MKSIWWPFAFLVFNALFSSDINLVRLNTLRIILNIFSHKQAWSSFLVLYFGVAGQIM